MLIGDIQLSIAVMTATVYHCSSTCRDTFLHHPVVVVSLILLLQCYYHLKISTRYFSYHILLEYTQHYTLSVAWDNITATNLLYLYISWSKSTNWTTAADNMPLNLMLHCVSLNGKLNKIALRHVLPFPPTSKNVSSCLPLSSWKCGCRVTLMR